MTLAVGRETTSRQRRESVAERLSAISGVLDAFDADLAARPADRAGALDTARMCAVVRALLPLALGDPTFDVTVTVGSTGGAVRVHHPAGRGPVAQLVDGPADEVGAGPATTPGADSPVGAGGPPPTAARELAQLLRHGGLGRRLGRR